MNNHAIEADYYLYGIELGILDYELAISWAYKIIEEEDQPAAEIIEVALSKPRGRNGIIEALSEVEAIRDTQRSGFMLLSELLRRLENGTPPKSIAAKALNVAWAAKFSEELVWQFDAIDDEMSLAEQGIYSDVEQCSQELRKLLKQCQNQKT